MLPKKLSREEMLYEDSIDIFEKGLAGKNVSSNKLSAAKEFLGTNIAAVIYLDRLEKEKNKLEDKENWDFESEVETIVKDSDDDL